MKSIVSYEPEIIINHAGRSFKVTGDLADWASDGDIFRAAALSLAGPPATRQALKDDLEGTVDPRALVKRATVAAVKKPTTIGSMMRKLLMGICVCQSDGVYGTLSAEEINNDSVETQAVETAQYDGKQLIADIA